MHFGFERRHLRCLPWPMLMPLCSSKEVLQIQGMVRWFSVIYGVTEKEPEKKKAPNKQTNNADNFHLFKIEPLLEANNLLSHLRRNDISFPFFCFARTAAGRWQKLKEMKGTCRPLPVPSHCPSFTQQAEGKAVLPPLRHRSEMERSRWSPESIIHST